MSTYWQGVEFHPTSKVKKLQKRFTPYSYRRHADDTFRRLFERFRDSIVVLSYSSNGFPDLECLVDLLGSFKTTVTVHEEEHRYHFGRHATLLSLPVDHSLTLGLDLVVFDTSGRCFL